MSNVHILKPEIVSKIAAGEVIERPASVVKELVENALDALPRRQAGGSDTIEVTLKDAGKSLIKIKDTGSGIAKDDLETIFHRHATSKIAKLDDLYAIHSLGFRGEALYSIGAIADVTLRSKTMAAPTGFTGGGTSGGSPPSAGWEIHYRGGEKLDLHPCALAQSGTEIEIKELFFNTPARKKFLKSNTTEIHQVLNVFLPYALLHENVRFKLTHEGRDLVDARPGLNRRARIADSLHLEEKHLIETRHALPERGLSVHLILGDINIQRTRRDMQFIFVNNRPVQNKSVSFHLNQVYRLIMPEGAHPFFTAYIEVPAENLDVNIHPTKREVKIKDEAAICSLLRHICEEALMKTGQVRGVVGSALSGAREDAVERALMGAHASEIGMETSLGPEIFQGRTSQDYAYPGSKEEQPGLFIPEEGLTAFQQESLQGKLANSRYIGAFLDKFLFFGTADAVLVIDQHAAAERVTYEKLIRQMNKGEVEVQGLLSPVIIKLSPQELLVWEEAQEELKNLGLETNQWDKETIAVHTYPTFLKDIECGVRFILAGETLTRGDHDALARRACRSSVMAGDALNPQQAQHLRDELLQCLDPFTCPHGRPSVIELSENFLDKQFLRT